MHRRTFLRGLGGAVVAAPFLESLGNRRARAQSVAPPRRLIAMFTHYGCLTNRFFPKKSHGQLSAEQLRATTLAPLAPFAGQLLLPRGIRAMNEWTAELSRGQGNGQHEQASGSYFTCQPLRPNSDTPFDFTPNTRFPPSPIGPSLDHVMAQQLSPKQIPFLLSVGGFRDSKRSAVSYSAAETLFNGSNLTQAYSALTNLDMTSPTMSPDSYQAARGRSIIDLVRNDLDTLARQDMSESDHLKLAAWKELLHETGSALTPRQCSLDNSARLRLEDGTIRAVRPADNTTDSLTYPVTVDYDMADMYSHVAVLAAACNANPVIVLKYPPNFLFSGLGVTMESHNLSHRLDNAGLSGTCLPDAIEMISRIDAFYARKFANLVAQLQQFTEGEQTLLDNTAAVWFQEMSDGAAHNLNNLPIVQAGSCGGYFKTGFSINVEDGSPDLTPGNSELLCQSGEPETINLVSQSTGTDPALANAPINKYFCNLMNALGVKAGVDGFPLAGGQAEVTRFGRYDRTEDFIHGDLNPPMIHDPGEFSALRA